MLPASPRVTDSLFSGLCKELLGSLLWLWHSSFKKFSSWFYCSTPLGADFCSWLPWLLLYHHWWGVLWRNLLSELLGCPISCSSNSSSIAKWRPDSSPCYVLSLPWPGSPLTLHSAPFALLQAHYCSLNAEHTLLGFFCLPWLFCLQYLSQMSRII